MNIPVDKILPNPEQPRDKINPESLQDLVNSIREIGLINAITVEEAGESYILIDGERRWRASILAGLKEIEASVRPSKNGSGAQERLAMATAANMQRSDMNVIEQAKAIRKMLDMGYTYDEVGRMVGLTKSPISLRMRLLDFPEEVQLYFSKGKLPFSMRVIYALDKLSQDKQIEICRRAALHGMTEKAISTCIAKINPLSSRKYEKADTGYIRGALDVTKNHNLLAPMRLAVQRTCKECEMGGAICKSCPVVMLLDYLDEGG